MFLIFFVKLQQIYSFHTGGVLVEKKWGIGQHRPKGVEVIVLSIYMTSYTHIWIHARIPHAQCNIYSCVYKHTCTQARAYTQRYFSVSLIASCLSTI